MCLEYSTGNSSALHLKIIKRIGFLVNVLLQQKNYQVEINECTTNEVNCPKFVLQLIYDAIQNLNSAFYILHQGAKGKKKNKVKEKKLNNSLYSRNKSVLFALVYSCDFSHAKIKQFLRLISHHHTIQCLVGLLFINHKVFSYLLVHFCLSLLFKS